MVSGGARTRSGSPPDPQALRRDRKSDAAGWVTLPAEGRLGDPPAWPLPGQSPREVELWAELWARPQAVQWEAMDQQSEVALYARRFAEAEKPGSPVGLNTLVRQLGDALGLTIPGLLRNRWKIAADEVKAKRETTPAVKPAAAGGGARSRFKVVDGSGG